MTPDLEQASQFARTVQVVGGLLWCILGSARDIRVNGHPVPSFVQGCCRLLAPSLWLAVILFTEGLRRSDEGVGKGGEG